MELAELGEFPLIARVEQILAGTRPDVVVGIGDDVAVLEDRGDEFLLATVDSQVESVHFLRDRITPRQLGRRALAINLSDIAAMGGRAEYALVSLALPPGTELSWVEELYRGLREEAERSGVVIVGGNMARSASEAFVDVCVLGRVRREHLLLRSGARPGDRVLVTGSLGDSAAGLALLLSEPERGGESEAAVDWAAHERLLERHFTPTPRLAEAAVIARSQSATAMIDLSDGLSSDIGHICDRSRVGVRLWADRLPISAEARQVAGLLDRPLLRLALEGGEDYELCFTAPPEATASLITAVERETGTPVTVVGEILPASQGRRLVLEDGQEVTLDPKGWEHFRPADSSGRP